MNFSILLLYSLIFESFYCSNLSGNILTKLRPIETLTLTQQVPLDALEGNLPRNLDVSKLSTDCHNILLSVCSWCNIYLEKFLDSEQLAKDLPSLDKWLCSRNQTETLNRLLKSRQASRFLTDEWYQDALCIAAE